MTIDEFSSNCRTIRFPQKSEDYFRLGKMHVTGCDYYVYVDENLNIVNPYTKKDEDKHVIGRLVSTASREDVIEKAHLFILNTAKEVGLFDESVCDPEIAKRQLNYIEQNNKLGEEVRGSTSKISVL